MQYGCYEKRSQQNPGRDGLSHAYQHDDYVEITPRGQQSLATKSFSQI